MPRDEPRQQMNDECGTEWHVGCRMSLGVEIGTNWGPRLRTGGNGWIEFLNSQLRKVINESFLSSVSCLLFSSPQFITSLNLGLVLMALARVLPPPGVSQWQLESPHTPDPWNGYRTVPFGSRSFQLVWAHMRHDCLTLAFIFFAF